MKKATSIKVGGVYREYFDDHANNDYIVYKIIKSSKHYHTIRVLKGDKDNFWLAGEIHKEWYIHLGEDDLYIETFYQIEEDIKTWLTKQDKY